MRISFRLRCREVLGAVVATVAGATPLAAQRAVFEHYSVDRGLSQSTVRAGVQDRAGFIWLGTFDGLNRFDGYAFTTFRRDDADSLTLSDNYILSLREEGDGMLWVGTSNGFNRFDTRTGHTIRYFAEPGRWAVGLNRVATQLRDRSGRLWVGTQGGLGWLDEGRRQIRSQELPGVGPTTEVAELYEDGAGMLWLGLKTEGLVRFDPRNGTSTAFRHVAGDPASLAHNTVRAIQEDARGELWLGTDGGLVHFDRASGRFAVHALSTESALALPRIITLALDSTKGLWIGTDGDGLYRFDPRTDATQHFAQASNDPTGLGLALIYDLWFERGGALWIGGVGDGANRMDLGINRFDVLRGTKDGVPGLGDGFTQALHLDEDGIVWIGTRGGGLHRFDRRTGAVRAMTPDVNPHDNASLHNIASIAQIPGGDLLLSAPHGGLFRFDRRTERFARLALPPCDRPLCDGSVPGPLFVDRGGRVWLDGGAVTARFDLARGSMTTYDVAQVNGFFQDRAGAIWIATRHGVVRIDSDSSTPVRYEHWAGDSTSLSDNDVRAVAEDSAGGLWIGTGAGLNAFDRGTQRFRQIRRRDGLRDEFIYAILADARGDLWLSTNQGLERYSPVSGRIRHYDPRDGLQSNEFNTNVARIGGDGIMYFGGIAGLNFFDPNAIVDNPMRPEPAITGFKRFNRPEELSRLLDPAGRLVIPARDNLISFEFSALSYRLPERNRYAYRLEGFDREWIDIGAKREATYTNLDPGSYTLRIKATNNDGVWGERELALPLVITPPWWRALWFRVAMVVSLAAAILAGVRLRLRAMQRRTVVLEALVEERTREVRRQELALRDASRRAGMAEVATGVLHNIGNVFNSVSVSTSVIERLVRQSKAPDVGRAVALLRDQPDLGAFLTADARGRQLPVFLERVSEQLVRDRDAVLGELDTLTRSVGHAAQIIGAQQALARVGGLRESLDLAEVARETVDAGTRFWDRDQITLRARYDAVPPVQLDRHQLVQVLDNLLLNARQAVMKCPPDRRTVAVEVLRAGERRERVQIRVVDNGIGIAPENLVSIFNYGFTTRPDGHGFGLHSAANAIQSFDGTLRVESLGLGHGATFIVDLPADPSSLDQEVT